jgi:ribose 5-phosphate isomerase A
VVPIARTYALRELKKYGTPKLRSGFTTDNGNVIIDVHGVQVDDAATLEQRIDSIVGVVTNGLFAARGADILLLGTAKGVIESRRPNVRMVQ